MVWLICVFYVLLGGLGLGLHARGRDASFVFDPLSWPPGGGIAALAAALATLAAAHWLSRRALPRWDFMKRAEEDIRRCMGGLTGRQILTVALASGLGEEFFFRGWLLNETGLFASSLIFGLAHVPPNRNWLYWPVFTLAMGLVMGGFCLWTGSLAYAVLLHAGINFLNLRHILAKEPPPDPCQAG